MSTFFYLIGMSLLSPVVSSLLSLLNVLLSFICYECIVYHSTDVSKMSRLFTKRGWRQTHYLTPGKLPGDGWSLLFIEYGCIIGYKSCVKREQKGDDTTFMLYIFGTGAYTWLCSKLNGNNKSIEVEYFCNPSIYRYDVTRSILYLKEEPTTWQSSLVDKLFDLYVSNKRASALICGPPGVGKSQIAFFLNCEIKKRTQNNAHPLTVIADPTRKGMTLGNLCGGSSKIGPIILLFNEYDAIVKHAENIKGESSKSDGMCIAETRTSFLDALDQLSNTRFVILIATMNGDALKDIPLVYRRPGRMDLIYSVPEGVKAFE